MWWLVCTVVFSIVRTSSCRNESSLEDEFASMLYDAASDVLAQNSELSSKIRYPPAFNMSVDFMRSFRPGSGVGNREELVVEEVHPLPVFEDAIFSKFLFKHFNNTDYIAGVSSNSMVLYRVNASSSYEYLVLSGEDAVFNYDIEWEIIDVVLFTRFVKNSESLYVAIAIKNDKDSVVYVYEINGDSGVLAAVISTSSSSVKKVSYVQSSYGGYLAFLSETTGETGLVYKQQGRGEMNRYIEVNYPSAVDFVTFMVHGHGYIAVADGGFCDVFKMDQFVGSHKFFDRLGPFSGIEDLEYFRLGFHHYLAIVDSAGHHLYIWKKGEFASKQTLQISSAAQLYAAPVESCRDEVILVTVTEEGGTHLHVFNGQNEEFITIDTAVPDGYFIKPGSVTSLTYQDTVVMLFVDFDQEHKAFVIKTSLKPSKDPILVKGKKVSEVMKGIQKMLVNQDKEIKRIEEILKDAVRKNGTQHISSIHYFHDLSTTDETEIEKINEFKLKWEDSSLTLEEYRKGTEDLEREIEYLENLVADIEKTMPDVVRLNEDAVITGKKIFTGHISADTLVATSLNLPTVAGMDLRQIQRDVYRLDKPQFIDGTLVFKEPLIMNENLYVDRTINGIDIGEEVMTTNTEQTSNAEMMFMSKLAVRGDLDVSGKINDIDLSEEVVTLAGNRHISGKKSFMNGIEARKVQTKLLDGVDIDDLYRRAFTISGNQIVSEDALFSVVNTNDIILNGLLNGYNVKELQNSIVRIDRPSRITGFKNFLNDVEIGGELTVHGTVNGLKIPDDLVLTDRPQNITGTKEFLGRVIAHEVHVQGKVDGLKVPEDIVTLSGDEEIPSTLYFADGIAAEKNIIVEGLVDLVDISEIAKQAMKLNESYEFDSAIFLGPVIISGDMNVKGLVNKVDLNKILKDLVYKDERPIEISSTKHFQMVTADQVNLYGTINGFNILTDFMKVSGPQNITGKKSFKRAVFNSIRIEDDMIDGLNITDFYRRKLDIIVEEDSEIDKEIEFENVVVEGNLAVRGTIDGIRIPEDVVLRNSSRSISNKHFANRVSVDHLVIYGDVNVDDFIGKNLTKFYNERVTLSGNQTINGDIWLENVAVDKMAVSGLVNGFSFSDFAANVMSKSKPQTITAVKEFSGNVSVLGDIYTKGGINGFKLSDVKRRAFKLLEDNIVTAPLEFEDNVTLNNLEVAGDINGVNITRLSVDSLKKVADIQYVQGKTHFHNGFHVTGDIIATTVNGLILKEDVLLKSIPQTIRGNYRLGSVGLGGNLTLNGSISGLDLSEVAPKLARIDDSETVIESDITFTSSIHVIQDIEVTGTVNEVKLRELFDNVLRKTGNQTVTGNKVFGGNVTIMGDIELQSVNGVGWKDFLEDVVWINAPQEINSPKTFTNDVIVPNMFVSGIADVRTVNGKDFMEFIDDAVFIDQPANITGPVTFKNPVEITGDLNADLINGLQLKTDVITIMCSDDDLGPQHITGVKTFQKLKVSGEIFTNSVNSYDLLELYEDTLLTEGNQIVTGLKVVSGDVTFKRNVHPNLVNGMTLRKDLVTLHTEQTIEGPLIFKGDVFVEKDLLIKGPLNGVDLYNLEKEAVYLETDQVIEGTYSLQRATVASNVNVNGTVNDLDLTVFQRNVTEFLQDVQSSVAQMEQLAQDHCELAKYLQESLEKSYYALDSFITYQEFEYAASFIEVTSDQDISLLYLDDMATSAVSVQNVWDKKTKRFQASNFSTTLIARRFLYNIGGLVVTINIGINSKDSTIVIERSGHSSTVESEFSDASMVLRKSDVAIALLFPSKSTCNLYFVKESREKAYTFHLDTSLDVGKGSKSIVMFEASDTLYLAVSSSYSTYGESSKIYYRASKWQQLQRITSLGLIVKHFAHQGYHYLVFVNDAPVYESKEPKSIQVHRNSGSNGRFALFQKIPFDDARGMDVFQFGDSLHLHLAVWNGTIVQIFGLEGEAGLKELFTIHGDCVRDVKHLFIENDLYLVVGQQNLKTSDAVKSVIYRGLTKGVKYDPYDVSYC